MTTQLYLAFVAATTVLMLIPGPNVALIVANSVGNGVRFGLLTVAGTSAAMGVQLAVVALGMTSLLATLGVWFEALRWVGVAYLLFLAVQAWLAPASDLTQVAGQPKSARRVLARGFLVSLTNPKTIFFYGAFLPQFIAPHAALAPQLAALSVTFVALAITVDSVWALGASRLRGLLSQRGRLRNRLSAGIFLAAGLGLATARKAAA